MPIDAPMNDPVRKIGLERSNGQRNGFASARLPCESSR